jgi:NAD(P)-dependent dehydrogenase (short-subunit alcohol dehydrogenase family)
MARVLVTGSNDGLGRDAARRLLDGGHEVVGHARNQTKADGLRAELPAIADVLVADLTSLRQVRAMADAANATGAFDAVIHNAGIYLEPCRIATEDGHSHVLTVNALAPYVLTARMLRPQRLVYLTSGLQASAADDLDDIDWRRRRWNAMQAYAESKLYDATLAAAVARRWPDVRANSVSPGWVATKMGGPGAPDDLAAGSLTQAWLAVSDEPAAQVSGAFLYHQQVRPAPAAVTDPAFQDALLAAFEELTGDALP